MMLAVEVQGLSATALAYVAAAVAVIGAISVYGLLHVDRRWASYTALLFEAVLVALFAYTVNIIYALYSAPGFGSTVEDIVHGVTYQRVAAGILSAMLFLAALISIGYYMELQKRGEGHE
ncbi:MAG: hypothetical protein GU356_05440 [Pyrobaculum sp.]|jgi:hypothetical protein|nr:hypothetical protein [Pyrobaculum sp.]